MNDNRITDEDGAIRASVLRRIARHVSYFTVERRREIKAAHFATDTRDAAIMVARTIARSGRKDGFAESCAEFVTKHTGLTL